MFKCFDKIFKFRPFSKDHSLLLRLEKIIVAIKTEKKKTSWFNSVNHCYYYWSYWFMYVQEPDKIMKINCHEKISYIELLHLFSMKLLN